jgi:hypothetical protein
MKPRFPLRGQGKSAPQAVGPLSELNLTVPAYREDRACCCPAQPVIRAIMPSVPRRPYPVDLLLCGHHYRICRQALIVAGASVYDMPGKADAAAAALLDVVRAPARVR